MSWKSRTVFRVLEKICSTCKTASFSARGSQSILWANVSLATICRNTLAIRYLWLEWYVQRITTWCSQIKVSWFHNQSLCKLILEMAYCVNIRKSWKVVIKKSWTWWVVIWRKNSKIWRLHMLIWQLLHRLIILLPCLKSEFKLYNLKSYFLSNQKYFRAIPSLYTVDDLRHWIKTKRPESIGLIESNYMLSHLGKTDVLPQKNNQTVSFRTGNHVSFNKVSCFAIVLVVPGM